MPPRMETLGWDGGTLCLLQLHALEMLCLARSVYTLYWILPSMTVLLFD